MFRDKIYRHFFSELSKHFFIVIVALSTIVWAVQSVNFLDLIVEDGHSVALYLKYSFLNVTKIVTKFIPLSFLVSLIFTIGKFESDSELMALWTSGLSKVKIANFFFKVSVLVTFLQLFLACVLNPAVLNHSRGLIKSSDINFVSGTIKTNQFNDTIEGLTIFAEGKNKNGEFENIFIRDDSKILKGFDNNKDTSNITIFARKAKLIDTGNSMLALQEGSIQSENKDGKIKSVDFSKTQLNLSGMKTKSIIQAKVQETNTINLIKCLLINNKDFESREKRIINCPDRDKIEVLAEINRRFGMPLYIPIIALMCSFLLVNREESRYNNLYKYVFGGSAFFILVIAEILVRYSGISYYYSIIYYLFPLLLMPVLYLGIVRKFYFENLKN